MVRLTTVNLASFLLRFFYLLEKQSCGEGVERQIFHRCFYPPMGTMPRARQTKAGRQKHYPVTRAGAAAQALRPSSAAFPGAQWGAGSEVGQRGSHRCPHGTLASQAMASPAMPHHQPPRSHLQAAGSTTQAARFYWVCVPVSGDGTGNEQKSLKAIG